MSLFLGGAMLGFIAGGATMFLLVAFYVVRERALEVHGPMKGRNG